MTYCVAIKLNDGLVLTSDSRTNAGVDHIASFKKLHTFEIENDRVLFIQSAGNLATTQSVLSIIEQGINVAEKHILNTHTLFEAAEIVGRIIRDVIARDEGQNQGIDFSCNMLLSGQIKGDTPRLFHIYPQGNFIEACEDTPYFQVGESKYGKPILDRIIQFNTPLKQAMQCSLISMDSTLRSNLSVGMPLDCITYKTDGLKVTEKIRIDDNHVGFANLRQDWSAGIKALVDGLDIHI
ncbi:MAG: putative proteasome-type protease [Oceanicoccus sp.]|jgi:putative proteasome-type protease